MTTTIYSCGPATTSRELALICQDRHWLMFPELRDMAYQRYSEYIPRHPSELLTMLHQLLGKTFVTVSEHLILMFLKEVRDGRMHPDELRIYCVDNSDFRHNHLPGRRIMVDEDGDMDDWPGGFFRERAGLLF